MNRFSPFHNESSPPLFRVQVAMYTCNMRLVTIVTAAQVELIFAWQLSASTVGQKNTHFKPYTLHILINFSHNNIDK